MRDFKNIMLDQGYFEAGRWSKSDSTYYFANGSYMEFFSADDQAKLRGARRDILFLNEANNITFEAYEQLEVRTRLVVIIDFNPVAEFWAHEEVMPHYDHDFLILTYKDNEGLDEAIIASIESRMHRTNWWRIYGMGQVGFNEGQVYQDWQPISEVPDEARLLRHGLDFGYTNDPSAIVDIYQWNQSLILDEVLYATGQSNRELASAIRVSEGLGPVGDDNSFSGYTRTLTVADSAEPKSIVEIKRYGVNITGALKGQGSVNYGIQLVQEQDVFVTKRSLNLFKEQRNYLWKVDRDGRSLNVPEDQYNHGMDASRYPIVDVKGKRTARAYTNKPTGF